jgi:myo-inositol 2-dehydrogenase / D-chiro-inositol 1-dehydrogenase
MTIRREKNESGLSRRGFIAGASVATAATVLQAKTAFGYQANSKVRIGLIGCGGRGTWITNLFKEHGGYEIAAVHDYFQNKVDAAGDKFGVDASARFTGLKGYERMLEKVDAIAVESPPYFHPEQAAAGVAAGKHVYVAKPIAVDVPGCKSIEQSGADATKAGLCFLVDFQTRADQYYIESIRRVHEENALGKFAFGESTYHAGVPWVRQIEAAKEAATNPEARLTAWGLDQILSGDIITEQNIHTIDVMSWIMDAPPVCAFGTGGRKVRDYGDCWDTFSITFKYADNVGIAFSSRQFQGHGSKPEGIRNRMFGVEGVLETAYGDDTLIRGKNFYRGGKSPAIYKDGAVTNIATFHKSIQDGDYTNSTVAPSVRSNLCTVLGRTAAYKGEVVSWDDMIKCNEKLDPELKGLKS